jgi:F0F1-type ATP synthase delta subunit
LQCAVDPNLLAGYQAKVGNRVLDHSLRGQLGRMTERLGG